MENFDSTWVICGLIWVLIALSGTYIAAYVMDNFTTKKNNIIIILSIFFIIEIVLFIKLLDYMGPEYGGGYSKFSFENKFHLGYLASMFLQLVIGYIFARNTSDICPHCGAWNEINGIAVVDSREYSKWETHSNDIRDKHGNKVGSYDSMHLHNYNEKEFLVKCKKCGTQFYVKRTHEI